MGTQDCIGWIKNRNRFPVRIVVTCLCPTLMIKVCIVYFAVINTIVYDRTICLAPLCIGGNPLRGSVCIVYQNLCNRLFRSEPLHPVVVPPFFIGVIPPVTQMDSNSIHTFGQKISHVIGIIQDLPVIGGLGRGQNMITYPGTIDIKLIKSKSCHIGSG